MIDHDMGGCPKCGAPAADEDLACRQCGHSFLADSKDARDAAMTAGLSFHPLPVRASSKPDTASRALGYVLGAIVGTLFGRLTWRFWVHLLYGRH
ncbi:MAG TPA: hypothetical protein VF407_23105 [Polyangiaceae bacterium]